MNNNQKIIDALREAANFLEQHPDLPTSPYWSSFRLWMAAKDKAEMASLIRTCGGDWKKSGTEYSFYVTSDINFLFGLGITTNRETVCTARKVVKTIPAREQVVIPAQPEQTIETTEWDCPDSILRPAPALATEADIEVLEREKMAKVALVDDDEQQDPERWDGMG